MVRFLLLQEEHIFLLLVLLVFLHLLAIIVIFFFITLSQFVEKVKIMLSPTKNYKNGAFSMFGAHVLLVWLVFVNNSCTIIIS